MEQEDEENDDVSLAFSDLRETLISTNGLRCAHLNVNGLLNKIEQVRLLLYESKINILAISETHLSSTVSNAELEIHNYSLVRKDRQGCGNNWGGVLVYYENHIPLHEVDFKFEAGKTESIWLEINIRSEKLLVGCIYRPPNDKHFLKNFESITNRISHRKNILILGDLNIDFLKPSTALASLKRILYSSNLSNLISDATRITPSSNTLIDVILSSIPSRVTNSGSYCSCISDHNLVFATLQVVSYQKRFPKLITVKNYKNVDLNNLKRDIESAPWQLIDIFDDPEDSVWCWESLLKTSIGEHIKPRKVKVRAKNQPWMNGQIRKLLNNRFKLFKKAKLSNDKHSAEWKEYKKMRNYCTNLIREAKANYWKLEFQSSKTSKSFWNSVNKFNGSSANELIGPLVDDSKIMIDDLEKANHMNDFFANVGKRLSERVNYQIPDPNSSIYRVTPTISEIVPDKNKFSKAFSSTVKIGKACGPDNVSARDLKLHEEISINGLFKVFQKSVSSKRFPSCWKEARVTCLHKKGSKKDCSNYRPISLLSISSKVVERCVQ